MAERAISPEDEKALAKLRASLLRNRPPDLQVGQGQEAMQQHKLVAASVLSAARLHRRKADGEGQAWVRYVTDFYPVGRNGEADAQVLWEGWRCALLKDDTPVVPITHGLSIVHWTRDEEGRPRQNLEDAWSDFEHSVNGFIDHLRENSDRRMVALKRFAERDWQVRAIKALAGATVMDGQLSASLSTSTTLITPPKPDVAKASGPPPKDR